MELTEPEVRLLPQSVAANVWTNSRFLRLWIGSALTNMAFSIYLLTETWYVVQKLDQEAWLGIVMMITTIPRVLLMAVGGVFADRVRRSHILFLLNISRAIMLAAMIGLLLTHSLALGVLFVCALVFGVLDAFFWPADRSILPTVVHKQQLVKANSIMETTNQLFFFIGPALAGVLLKYTSFEVTFGICSSFLLVAGIILKTIREDVVESNSEQSNNFLKELKEGVVYIRTVPLIITFMGVSIIVNLFCTGPLTAGVPVFVKAFLGGDVITLSYLESSVALGMIAGGLITSLIGIKRKRAVVGVGIVGLLGICIATLSQIAFLWQGIVLAVVVGVSVSVSNILTYTLSQELIKPELMGRVQSLISTASMGFIPVSYALVSILLTSGLPIKILLLGSGTFLVLYIILVLIKVKSIWSTD